MITLNADDWQHLDHAYGSASDIPQSLVQLAANPRPQTNYDAEPWSSLWSSLCHQDDVYTASYAAVPHIIRICLESDGPVEFSFFLLPACIEVSRSTGRGPAIPDQLRGAYQEALNLLHECAFKHASDEWGRQHVTIDRGGSGSGKGPDQSRGGDRESGQRMDGSHYRRRHLNLLGTGT